MIAPQSRLRGVLLAVALTGAVAFAGCAPQPDLTTNAAARLQQHVLAVTAASKDGKLTDAMAALDAAEKEADRAADRGELTDERYRQILDKIRLVRADLQAAIDAAEKAEQERLAAEQAAKDAELAQQLADLKAQQQAAADQAAAAQAAADQAAADQAAADEAAKNNPGKGNGNGKDKPKDEDKGKKG